MDEREEDSILGEVMDEHDDSPFPGEVVEQIDAELRKREAAEERVAQKSFCATLDTFPPNAQRKLQRGWIADVELQPSRWIRAGMDVLRSTRTEGHVQYFGGRKGEPMNVWLNYPAFALGTELFFKGMWLYRQPVCRRIRGDDYVGPKDREQVLKQLSKNGHDLLGLIRVLSRMSRYRRDETSRVFLRRVSAIIRSSYFPHVEADKSKRRWASSRYPKRFYNDRRGMAHADSLQSFPDQRRIIALFVPMQGHLRRLWHET